MESCEIGEMDADACLELEKQILTDEIDDSEFLNFAVEKFDELLFRFFNCNIIVLLKLQQ